jgi:tRNA threonylcarbamoyladenosine modification (KEOPS) complex  Pcc1 subunit
MNNTLEIKLQLPKSIGKSCVKAIGIEARSYEMSRSKVDVSHDEKKHFLKIKIKAKDLSALRAAMNTYLRWVIICQDLLLHDTTKKTVH